MGVVLVAGLVGFVLGALLPVPAYRLSVPFGEPPRATCDHCGLSLAWVRLPPARCPQCTKRWGPPWWTTALVAGGASAVLALALGPEPVLVPFVALGVLGTGLGAIDIACHRLPTVVVLPAILAGVASLVALAALTGDWASFVRALLGSFVLGLVFELLYHLPGGNLGYGDVQLAALLGLFLGWLGWPAVIWGALLPWLINGPVVLTLLLMRRVGRKSRLPFGPALVAGAVLSVALVSALPL